MAEELTASEAMHDGRAVENHEGAIGRARIEIVEQARRQLLAGARLPAEQDRGIGVARCLDELAQRVAPGRAGAHQSPRDQRGGDHVVDGEPAAQPSDDGVEEGLALRPPKHIRRACGEEPERVVGPDRIPVQRHHQHSPRAVHGVAAHQLDGVLEPRAKEHEAGLCRGEVTSRRDLKPGRVKLSRQLRLDAAVDTARAAQPYAADMPHARYSGGGVERRCARSYVTVRMACTKVNVTGPHGRRRHPRLATDRGLRLF